jgi:hypothetical protein
MPDDEPPTRTERANLCTCGHSVIHHELNARMLRTHCLEPDCPCREFVHANAPE